MTDRFSVADLTMLAQKAALKVIEGKNLIEINTIRSVNLQDYIEALKEVRPSNSAEEIKKLEDWWK
jgi:SpoVK/Ycf46/Vps4 family AAA+-type ATPase